MDNEMELLKKEALAILRMMLGSLNQEVYTREDIKIYADIVVSMPQFTVLNADELVSEVQDGINVGINAATILDNDETNKPWLIQYKEKHPENNWIFWNRYRAFLFNGGYSNRVLSQVDSLTDKILDRLFDPTLQQVEVKKYGLVVGQVQSGKTSNYLGLVCKAADAGFKIIIVLAGVHNNLRAQTQIRTEEGFIGFDAEDGNKTLVGVGLLSKFDNKGMAVNSLTTRKNDFLLKVAASIGGVHLREDIPLVFVVKKNASVLERLIKWLKSQKNTKDVHGNPVINKSLLLIDDEADNASINTSKSDEEKASRINQLIRDCLALFQKKAYVGYTATPFANIFIPPTEDQLYPRDFIINLPAPANYIGPTLIFGTNTPDDSEDVGEAVLPIVVRVADSDRFIPQKHKKDSEPGEMPESLKLAIRCFILTCAIKRLRGMATEHNSMLVHISHYKLLQEKIRDLVLEEFDFYKNGIINNDPIVLELIKDTFETDMPGYKSYCTVSEEILNSDLREIDRQIMVHAWKDVRKELRPAVEKISVILVNGGSKEALDYEKYKHIGLSVIAVGGNKLSRGLTLEGLSVSYFLRPSRMYDTLMQMGRWFGYRKGYVDLCRLFITGQLHDWFIHITRASEDLRSEFDYMTDVVGAKPLDFALKVRTHPGVLQITASNRLRNVQQVEIAWPGRLIESYSLKKDPEAVRKNLNLANELVEHLPRIEPGKENGHLVWKDISPEIIFPFFDEFEVPDTLVSAKPQFLLKYIREKVSKDRMKHWSVAVISNTMGKQYNIAGTPYKIGLTVRTEMDECGVYDHENYWIRRQHIIDPSHESIDLEPDIYQVALERTREKYKEKKKKEYKHSYPSGTIIRKEKFRKEDNPLLLLYYLNPEELKVKTPLIDPVIGFAVSFPAAETEETTSYAVNSYIFGNLINDDLIENEVDQEDDE